MKKILIILMGVLLIYSEPVIAKNEITIASTIKVAKNALKNKKTVQKKKYKSVKNSKKKAYKSVKKTKQSKKIAKKVQKKKIKYKRVRYNVGEIQSYAHQLVLSYGWTEADYQALVLLVNRESSWNPYAINKKSGACGLFQAYPCSKMAKYGKDYRTNYKVQVAWGMDYIKNRYKTPSQAWGFWQSHHWY